MLLTVNTLGQTTAPQPTAIPATDTITVNTLMDWLKNGDFQAFQLAANNEKSPIKLPQPFDAAFVSPRPKWCQNLSDSSLWHSYRAGQGQLAQLLLMSDLNQPLDLQASHAELDSMAIRRKNVRMASWVGLGLAFMMGLLAMRISRRNQTRIQLKSETWALLVNGLKTGKITPEAQQQWLAFQHRICPPSTESGLWSLLNGTEREVAEYLAQAIPVREISARMSCSPSYVYNIRSRIRQKWDLHPDEDLKQVLMREISNAK
jgi:DNA-binding CsgD family transcriptional regulator